MTTFQLGQRERKKLQELLTQGLFAKHYCRIQALLWLAAGEPPRTGSLICWASAAARSTTGPSASKSVKGLTSWIGWPMPLAAVARLLPAGSLTR
jgi:hypothetical protein